MKNTNNKLIKKLAEEFNSELLNLPIKILPNNDILYDDYLIKKGNNQWEVYDVYNRDLVSKFYLKSCALIATYFYKNYLFNEYREVKQLDRHYQKNFFDSILFQHNLKLTQDFDQKVIFLNSYECSRDQADYYKRKISSLFKRTFV